MTRLTFYGGVGEIGGTKVLLEEPGRNLLLDFGLSYGRYKLFYEEYLRPRAGAGLLDYLEMGIVPPLEGIYRHDLQSPGLWERYRGTPGYRRIERIDAVLLTHAHFDHSAHISFLAASIPVYSTGRTALLCKAIQDSGRPGPDLEVCSYTPREIERPRGWKQEALLGESRRRIRREFRLADSPPSPLGTEARRFWESGFYEDEEKSQTEKVPPLVGASEAPFPLRSFPVDHSIHGASAWAIETSSGWVVYTGDLRMHGARGALTRAFVEEAARLKPRALIIEATNAGSAKYVTESEVRDRALEAVTGARGLVIADFSARDMERLAAFLDVAKRAGRKLVVLPKDVYLLKALRLLGADVPDPQDADLLIYQETTSARYPDRLQQALFKEYGHKIALASDVQARQGELVLCFSFFDVNELAGIRPRPGSRYVYSSSEPHDEEQQIDFRRLHQWLRHFSIQAVGLPVETPTGWAIPAEEKGLHASGHAYPPDLLQFARSIAPGLLIPVHTEHPGFYSEGLANTRTRVLVPELFKAIEV